LGWHLSVMACMKTARRRMQSRDTKEAGGRAIITMMLGKMWKAAREREMCFMPLAACFCLRE